MATWDAIAGFRDQIRDAGGKVGANFDMLALKSAILTARYTTNAEKIDDLNNQIDSIRTAAAGSFMHDPFQGGLADFDLQVAADTNDTNAMTEALAAAAAKGLDGPLAAALASSGNLLLAQAFAGMDAAGIERRERAYAARDVAGKALGDMAVQVSGLATQVSSLVAENAKLIGQINQMEGKIKNGVYAGAYDGTAQRERDRDKKLRGRTGAGR